ncbi:unnamed protein product [Acanthoscelides obtectus]|uniref:Uncharacterized protein n=1 Tax=Acanthoscelides obtectus TaxID=200917 RepID=A0A9P0PBP3_ACAOB|nr:unnamed protein product [Acanthoscelides obtectus]CAK1665160.1 hypothetical protein AOBTE_LOCUS24691 [Acanthoscelides obtectus]
MYENKMMFSIERIERG